MRSSKIVVLALICLMLGTACAARHQIPATEQQLQGTVTTAESAYKSLYSEHKAGQLSQAAMVRVDELYQAWRQTQQLLVDAVRSGAVAMKE